MIIKGGGSMNESISHAEQQKNYMVETIDLARNIENTDAENNKNLAFLVEHMMSMLRLPFDFNQRITFTIENINYDSLAVILTQSKHTMFKAVCSEFLWDHSHLTHYAKDAILYYQLLLADSSVDSDITKISVAICRIYSKYQTETLNFREFFDETVRYINKTIDSDDYCNKFIIDALIGCNLYLEEIKNLCIKLASYYEDKSDYSRAITYLEIAHDSLCNNKSDKNTIKVRIAKDYELSAKLFDWENPRNAHIIISTVQTAMKWWGDSGSANAKAERNRLAKLIIPIKKLSLETMAIITSKGIDISDWIKTNKEYIATHDFRSVFAAFVTLIPLENRENIKNSINDRDFVHSQFFQTNIVDKDGRLKAIIPAGAVQGENTESMVLDYKTKKHYETLCGFLQRFLYFAKEKYSFSEEEISFIFENNSFIDPDRIGSYKKGILFGFQEDYATSLHLLMPQVENSIRVLAEQCGAVVYRTDASGVEECLSLDTILKCEELSECLEDDLLFNLKLLYTSSYGYGMRNEISHSLLSDDELNSSLGFFVWWFTLRLCCMFSPICIKSGWFSLRNN